VGTGAWDMICWHSMPFSGCQKHVQASEVGRKVEIQDVQKIIHIILNNYTYNIKYINIRINVHVIFQTSSEKITFEKIESLRCSGES
jgi:hypothetical protein